MCFSRSDWISVVISCRFGLLDFLSFGAARGGGPPPAILQYCRGKNCASLAPGTGGATPSASFLCCFQIPDKPFEVPLAKRASTWTMPTQVTLHLMLCNSAGD